MVSPGFPRKYAWDGIQHSHVRCKPCKLWWTTAYSRVAINPHPQNGGRTQAHNTLLPGIYSPSTTHPNCYRNLQYAYPRMMPTHALAPATPPSASTPWEDYVEAKARDNQVIVTACQPCSQLQVNAGTATTVGVMAPKIFSKISRHHV